ncbi:MAG: family 43 glycosylhydrolase [Phycisphaerae bacterium]|jgi:beta-xylosidase|nr:family 43 glycosylhydrolase [Phycisphaerae bacterium]
MMNGRYKTVQRCATLSLAAVGLLASLAMAVDPIKPRPTEARPLLTGNWADPTILKDGEDYYMTHTSFEFQPGLLIWHSKDLQSWKPVARAVVNQEGSIWAPDLIKHKGRYFIYYPAARKNWVVTSKSITGPWSKPVSLGVGGIDPGHVVGPDAQRYMHLSGGAAVKLSADGCRALEKSKKVYKGWSIPRDWTIEGFYLESPKLMQRGGWYYLTSAQGGTAGPATSHMVVSARSKGPLGPWANSPHNPIIRTWDRDEAWWSKGHGTLVEGPRGKWYCVLHGYMNSQRTFGRCTLIEPIEWTRDGWFRPAARWPDGWKGLPRAAMPMSDEFDGKQLGIQWQFYQQYEKDRFALKKGELVLQGRGATPGKSQPLTVMAMHRGYEIETQVSLEGEGSAGLMLFGTPGIYIGPSISSDGRLRRVQEGFRRYGSEKEPAIGAGPVTLRIVNNKQDVRFCYKTPKSGWIVLQPGIDAAQATPGWYSLRPALFATGKARARFRYFHYRPLKQ